MKKYLKTTIQGLMIALILTACGTELQQEAAGQSLSVSCEEVSEPGEAETEEDAMPEDGLAVFDRLMEEGQESIFPEEAECLLEYASDVENRETWLGEWRRTNVERGCGALLQIEEKEEGGCYARVEAAYYSHNGGAGGKLYFLDAAKAFLNVNIDGGWGEQSGERAVLLLTMGDDTVTIKCLGPEYGCGAGVTLRGIYVRGEPVYTNENVLAESFTEEEQERIKAFLEEQGYSYEEEFVFPVEEGAGIIRWITGEFPEGKQTAGKLWEWYIPTVGNERFTLFLSEEGYCYWYKWGTGYLTDDPERADRMQGPKTGSKDEDGLFPEITGGWAITELSGCAVKADCNLQESAAGPFRIELQGGMGGGSGIPAWTTGGEAWLSIKKSVQS